MIIERICPSLVPAIREAFAVPALVSTDHLVPALLAFGDCCIGIGASAVLLLVGACWLGVDVVRFVRGQFVARGKHAA